MHFLIIFHSENLLLYSFKELISRIGFISQYEVKENRFPNPLIH